MIRGRSIEEGVTPGVIDENSDEEDSLMEKDDINEEDDNDDDEKDYGGELDANREAREARA